MATKPKAPKASPMDAMRDTIATLQARFDTEVDRLEGRIADNKRAAIAAQRRADAAHAKATAAYEKLGMISDTLDLIPDQFATAHSRIEQLERKINDGVKVAIGALGTQGSDGLKSLTEMVPGITYLKSLSEQKPQREYANSIRRAGINKLRAETPFVPTNR